MNQTPYRSVKRGSLPAKCLCGNEAIMIDKISPVCRRCRDLEHRQRETIGASPRRSRAELAKAA